MENENLFIWSNEIKKCWFGHVTKEEPGEEGRTLVNVKITRGKVENGTFHEMFLAREYNITTDSLGYHPS